MSNYSLRGLFIDFDGTLADTLEALRNAYNRFLKEFAVTGSEKEFQALNGVRMSEIVSILQRTYQLPTSHAELLSFYNRLVDQAYVVATPMPGALSVIDTARNWGWFVGIVTSGTRPRVQEWMAKQAFNLSLPIVAGDDVAKGKPSPDLYLHALKKSGCHVDQSFAVEDSEHGVCAAIASGLNTFWYMPSRRPENCPREARWITHWSEILGVLNDA